MTDLSQKPSPSAAGASGVPAPWSLRPADPSDAPWMAELRADVMRPDLERLGRYDVVRVRRRFLDAYRPEHTSVIEVDGIAIGLFAVRPEPDERWFEHLYVRADHQGRGLGGQVLDHVLRADSDPRPFRLNVLQGSAARRLYERHGFVVEREDAIDVWMVRSATGDGREAAQPVRSAGA
ncbi:GNAT family N-acetyltransferase [Aeromicrobium fastidiosum]|uniref:GNAT family N-acetyltransferase n=1 Tax=Aeromicrobium fastidiosum TaxID=52699 RepID=A0A641AMR6_9ACTN|nr:GNAT family N-acetyltransferase [Aeromicrobium fastidiosum]KAA1376558.1 GNAT family N-acetyltransferase [Aeromicrobium fastidiosum]MBP2391519.1 GNAT superfamily N-acetyltransferase [Aeromicrobium fastidiosum]